MNIPLLNLHREYAFLKREIHFQLKTCFDSQRWVLGPKVAEFETKAARYLGAKCAVGVASGTDALILALNALALKLKRRGSFDVKDEIITTPFTFVATAESIIRSGAKPVFVDIDTDTFNIDPKGVEQAITKNTVGIMPVHLYGSPCDMEKIKRIARKHNVFVVEDAAQSFGAEYNGKKTGTFGDCGAFSFFPSKNMGAFGDAGMIATNSEAIRKNIAILRDHGQMRQYNARYIGFNSRLDSIQAAVLLAKLKHIDAFNKKRVDIAEEYNQAFREIPQIQIPSMPSAPRSTPYAHIYHLYTLKVSARRDKLIKYLNSRGIGARVYYPVTLDKMSAFRGFCGGKLKNAYSAARKVLSLPIHPFLTKKETGYIIKTIRSFFK